MYTKQDIYTMMRENEGKTFVIKTNTANGLGINGTDYDVYISRRIKSKRSANDPDLLIRSATRLDFVSATDGMLVLSEKVRRYCQKVVKGSYGNKYDFDYSSSMIYLPLSAICSIKFINPTSQFCDEYGVIIDASDNEDYEYKD